MFPRLLSRNVVFSLGLSKQIRFFCSKLPKLFDGGGKVVKPDKSLDYYSIFGLDKSFNVDTLDLAQTYKQLQRQLHPDKFVKADAEDMEVSEEWSALVNDGYKILKKPLPRALYLLDIVGFPLEEGSIDIDPEFLGEVMELNEEVAEAGSSEIKLLADTVKSKLEEYIEIVDVLFANGEFEGAREQVAHMKYYANVLDKIYEKETEFGMY
eukprot:GFUD01029706.1.p2 GENE.GFUD01029706.1~~GFUD01029706.1.p2  ORF type:complete len:210 (+),score=53.52 GFUD01029706.1:951-1580(+)